MKKKTFTEGQTDLRAGCISLQDPLRKDGRHEKDAHGMFDKRLK
jgi:hypothetical protein